MEENGLVLLTAEGKNGRVELTETSVRICEYKRGLTGFNKSKFDICETPRNKVCSARVSPLVSEIYIDVPGDGLDKCFTISFDEGYRPDFEKMEVEINKLSNAASYNKPWYADNDKLSHVESYFSEEAASLDANKACEMGWMPQGTSTTDGHINVGRTVAKTILTGGIGLAVLGASRTDGKVTITYTRTPEWLESHNKAVDAPIQAAPQPTDDPLQKMKQLKEMLDAGFISESEYNAKKADLLSRM